MPCQIQTEVEYKDKESFAIDVRFHVLDEKTLMARCHSVPDGHGDGPLSLVIWTTTQWTLPANQAVALSPDLEYAVVQTEGDWGRERLVVAEALLKDTMDRWGVERHHVVAYGRGSAFEGLKLQHPLYDREVPVILGEHVTLDAGTGAVHTAPGHGVEDYIVGRRYDLPVDNPVGGDGRFLPETPLFAGQHVLAPRAAFRGLGSIGSARPDSTTRSGRLSLLRAARPTAGAAHKAIRAR